MRLSGEREECMNLEILLFLWRGTTPGDVFVRFARLSIGLQKRQGAAQDAAFGVPGLKILVDWGTSFTIFTKMDESLAPRCEDLTTSVERSREFFTTGSTPLRMRTLAAEVAVSNFFFFFFFYIDAGDIGGSARDNTRNFPLRRAMFQRWR
jgi:hypothetical protein